tara:strand:- start:165 stop:680 length:516 start_codon:yes stop_codon:yes gene_type:complete
MAEAFLKDYFMKTSLEIEVISAGIEAKKDAGATEKAIRVMKNFNIDISDHSTRLISRDIVEKAELVIAMTRPHELSISKIQQQARNRTFLAGEIVRLGSLASKLEESSSFKSWIEELHSARGGHMTSGRAGDEVLDPFDKPLEEYEKIAMRINGICEVLCKLLTSEANKNP